MARSRQAKALMREAFEVRLKKSKAVIVAEYLGISAVEMSELRDQLRSAECELRIVKNRVAKKVLEAESSDEMVALKDNLVGPASVVHMYGDVASGAKKLLDFSKKNEALKIKTGIFDGKLIDIDEIKKIASLPPKEVLLGQIAGSLVAPHRNLLYVLKGVSEKLVRCISEVQKQK